MLERQRPSRLICSELSPLGGLRRAAGAQRMGGEAFDVEAGGGGTFDDQRQAPRGETRPDRAVAFDRAQDGTACDRGVVEPGPQCAHRAGRKRRAVRDREDRGLALLVGPGPAHRERHALGDELHVVNVECNQLAAAQGADEADKLERGDAPPLPSAVPSRRSRSAPGTR